jgi:L-ribulose-5-phosphate 3-epimerase
MRLGVRLESLGLPFRNALSAASRLAVAGVQFDATGELHPDRLSATGRREITHLLRSYSLELTTLHCPLRHGLDHAPNLDARLAHLQKAMTLSCDLGARLVIVDGGRIPEKDDDPRMATLREALIALGAHADRIGATLSLETGMDSGERFATFLNSLSASGLGVNYDPGNFLVHGFDPVAQIAPLKGLIVHAHAHDAKMGSSGKLAGSVAVGAGDVDWFALIGHLAATEYRGWLVVETDEPDAAAVETGVNLLRRLV